MISKSCIVQRMTLVSREPSVSGTRPLVRGDRHEETVAFAPDLVIVACADVDLDPLAVLRLRPGDAHVVTNAGGMVMADTVRDIAASRRSFGVSRVVVVQHHPCALLDPGALPSFQAPDPVARLRASLRCLTRPPLSLPTASVGGVLCGADGRVTRVRIS